MSYSFDQSACSIESRCVVMPAVIHYRPYFMGIWGFNGSVLTTIRYLLKCSFLQNKNISVLVVMLAYNRNIYMFWSVVSIANIFFYFVHAKLRTSRGFPKPSNKLERPRATRKSSPLWNRPFATIPRIQFCASFWDWRESWSSTDMLVFKACVHHRLNWVLSPYTYGFS